MHDRFTGWIGSGICTILTAVQTEHIFQIISLILTCVTTLVTLAYTLYRWYKKAKEDGKISKEELKEGIDIIKDGAEELSNNIKNNNKGDKD